MWKKIKYHPSIIRLSSWEYWPVYISNIPVFIFWFIQAIRARDPFFFAAVNPAIPTGGFFGEEKHKIYALIPGEYLPGTVFIPSNTSTESLLSMIRKANLSWPLVCKPDVGERGMHVKVVSDEKELIAHSSRMSGGIIIQEYIHFPLELSILCYHHPDSKAGKLTSICRKEFLKVTGDGVSTIADLIDQNPRAILQKKTLARRIDISEIPAIGQELILEPIGNHCRGTQFLNANNWITADLEKSILGILDRMPGVQYGRFDLRTASIEKLTEGKQFLIMEFNGVGSEPAHIYDPSYSVFNAYKDIWRHWQILLRIFRAQKAKGFSTIHWREGLDTLRAYFQYKKKASLTYGL